MAKVLWGKCFEYHSEWTGAAQARHPRYRGLAHLVCARTASPGEVFENKRYEVDRVFIRLVMISIPCELGLRQLHPIC